MGRERHDARPTGETPSAFLVEGAAASLHPPGALGSAYATAKAALNQLTRHLAADLEGTGVTANVIHPGDVRTAMWAASTASSLSPPSRDTCSPGARGSAISRTRRRLRGRPGGFSHTFTDFGHLTEVAIGLACYPLARGSSGNSHAPLRAFLNRSGTLSFDTANASTGRNAK
jgi:NAD(P)-dependent dehydrogenase (short-subunit alcohol dehydrogenase family)